MEDKYYTPEMKEFHPDFEFQYKNDDGWQDCILGKNDLDHPELRQYKDDLMKIAHASCRVKFLDKEDIEILGWIKKDNIAFSENSMNNLVFSIKVKYRGDDSNINMIYNAVSHWVLISLDNKSIFAGVIKNKSELGKLMEQLQIKP